VNAGFESEVVAPCVGPLTIDVSGGVASRCPVSAGRLLSFRGRFVLVLAFETAGFATTVPSEEENVNSGLESVVVEPCVGPRTIVVSGGVRLRTRADSLGVPLSVSNRRACPAGVPRTSVAPREMIANVRWTLKDELLRNAFTLCSSFSGGAGGGKVLLANRTRPEGL